MVAGVPAVARVADGAVAIDDEGAGHLERVADDAFDVVAFAGRLQPSAHDGRIEEDVPQRATPQPERLVPGTPRVGQTGEGRLEPVAKRLRLLWVALRDRDDAPAGVFDVLGALTERRQVLPAERSAEVPQEGDDDRPVAPPPPPPHPPP